MRSGVSAKLVTAVSSARWSGNRRSPLFGEWVVKQLIWLEILDIVLVLKVVVVVVVLVVMIFLLLMIDEEFWNDRQLFIILMKMQLFDTVNTWVNLGVYYYVWDETGTACRHWCYLYNWVGIY